MRQTSSFAIVALCGAPFAVGCVASEGTSADQEAPEAQLDDTRARQIVTSGAWTAEAYSPSWSTVGFTRAVGANAEFVGPAGGTRKMGLCALKQYRTASDQEVSCTTAADCLNAPTSLATGGFRYCTNPDGVGSKTCWYRPGGQSTYCAGTPVTGTAIGPGFYSTPSVPQGSTTSYWISYACFEGCSVTDPSSSSPLSSQPPPCQRCGLTCCIK